MATPSPFKNLNVNRPVHGITFLEDDQLIVDYWSEKAQFADVELSQKIEQVAQTRPTKPYIKWLVDLSAIREDANASDAWLYSDLIPFLLNEGYYYLAIVKPRYNYKSEDTAVDLIEIGDRIVGQFSDFETAFRWLKQQ